MDRDLDGVDTTGVLAKGNGEIPHERVVPTSVFNNNSGNEPPREKPVYNAQSNVSNDRRTNDSDMFEGTAETKIGGKNEPVTPITPPPPPPPPSNVTAVPKNPPSADPKPEVHFKNGTGVTVEDKVAGVVPQTSKGGTPPVTENKPEVHFKNGTGVTVEDKVAGVVPQTSKGGTPPVTEDKPEAHFTSGKTPPVTEDKPEVHFKNGTGVTTTKEVGEVPENTNTPVAIKPKIINSHAAMSRTNAELNAGLSNVNGTVVLGGVSTGRDSENHHTGAFGGIAHGHTSDNGVSSNIAGVVNKDGYGGGIRVSKKTESGLEIGGQATHTRAFRNEGDNLAAHETRFGANVGKDFNDGRTHLNAGIFGAVGKTHGKESYKAAGVEAGLVHNMKNGWFAGANVNADLASSNVRKAFGASGFLGKVIDTDRKLNEEHLNFHVKEPVVKQETREVPETVSTVNLNLKSNELFQFDKHQLSNKGLQTLNTLARMLIDPNVVKGGNPNQTPLHQMINSGQRITISGHTDFFGSDKYNVDLSAKRTEAVVGALSQYLAEYTKIPVNQVRSAFETRNVGESEATYRNFKEAKEALIADNPDAAKLKGTALKSALINFVANDRKVAVGLPPVHNIDKNYVESQYGNLGVKFSDGQPITIKHREQIDRVVGYNTVSGYMPKGSQAPTTLDEAAKYTIKQQKFEPVNTDALEAVKQTNKPVEDETLKNKPQPN